MYKRGEKTKEKNFLHEKVKFNIQFDGQWNVIPNCSHVNLGKVTKAGSFCLYKRSKGRPLPG